MHFILWMHSFPLVTDIFCTVQQILYLLIDHNITQFLGNLQL